MNRKTNFINNFFHIRFEEKNKKSIFIADQDKIFFLKLLKLFSRENEIKIHCYCVLETSVDFLIEIDSKNIDKFTKRILYLYEKYLQKNSFYEVKDFSWKIKLHEIHKNEDYLHLLKQILLLSENEFGLPANSYKWNSLYEYFSNSFVEVKYSLNFFSSKDDFFTYLFSKNKQNIQNSLTKTRNIKNQNKKYVLAPHSQKKIDNFSLITNLFNKNYLYSMNYNNHKKYPIYFNPFYYKKT